MVSNHLSYMDVVPLWLAVDGTFIAKSEIKSWPFFGWGTKILGMIFIDRALKRDVQRVNNMIKSTITEDQGIIIFPEGTSTKGETVLPFHPSLLEYPAQHNVPVSYATLTYQSFDPNKPASEYICWWGGMSFLDHFWELLKMPGFKADITFGSKRIVNADRKQLSDQLHQLVKANFQPVEQAGSTKPMKSV
ncbi:1-acyl-sn-glycerol-3-phosphate acyltransferase [Aliifodinibius sp. 1BSP15-2V2]|uniref:1-acyl-sn-glycerol-3-phosphate acyltransferase n=1 Tax=Fodinibius salsisoli TaxID=2820877 RepID=A0ABT3PR47_9BACT|nr:1-acyl-sn-glycerol-3-phosphate acyltransferase [Fodinibius salsisoli]